MDRVDDSKQRLSEAFARLEETVNKKLNATHLVNYSSTENVDETLKAANQSLLEQNTALQKKLFELERRYHALQSTNKETSSQIDDIILNLKNLLVEK
ncbi:MAG: hypothetical protein RLN62_00575 [Rickettsiales bacterium]